MNFDYIESILRMNQTWRTCSAGVRLAFASRLTLENETKWAAQRLIDYWTGYIHGLTDALPPVELRIVDG